MFEPLQSVMEPMHIAGTAPLQMRSPHLTADDEGVAARSAARLLITADAPGQAEALARRMHAATVRGRSPFLRFEARDLPVDSHALQDMLSRVLDAVDGGTVFIDNVQEMPRAVQDVLIELLTELSSPRAARAGARVVTGTTVSLLECVEAGMFSEQLLYRLNVIHVDARLPRRGATPNVRE